MSASVKGGSLAASHRTAIQFQARPCAKAGMAIAPCRLMVHADCTDPELTLDPDLGSLDTDNRLCEQKSSVASSSSFPTIDILLRLFPVIPQLLDHARSRFSPSQQTSRSVTVPAESRHSRTSWLYAIRPWPLDRHLLTSTPPSSAPKRVLTSPFILSGSALEDAFST